MQVRAIHRNARMAPRKIRPLARMLRGLGVMEADAQLTYIPGKAAELVRGVLSSALANARENHGVTGEGMKVVHVHVDEGLKMRRFRAGSRGMAHPYAKLMSHITVVLEGEETATPTKKETGIETIDATTYVELGGTEEAPQEKDPEMTDETADSAPVTHDKETGEAFQITKMMQQGGNKKKSHRRKSM